jgi:hypothetical protein
MTGKMARADIAIAGNPRRKAEWTGKHSDFGTRIRENVFIHDKYQRKVIKDDPGAKFDSLSQTDHEKPDGSENGSDFLKELSHKFDLNATAWMINTNHEIGTKT